MNENSLSAMRRIVSEGGLFNRPQYKVNNIEWRLIHTGIMSGVPAVHISFQGCPAQCKVCNFRETWDLNPGKYRSQYSQFNGKNSLYGIMESDELAQYAGRIFDYATNALDYRGEKWAYLAGGDPAIYNLDSLTLELKLLGFKVGVETSGLFDGHIRSATDFVAVTPRLNNPAGIPLDFEACENADELRFLIRKDFDRANMFALLDRIHPKTGQIQSVLPDLTSYGQHICRELSMHYGFRLVAPIA